jgi:pyridoxamine 5'-phosphate oxidase
MCFHWKSIRRQVRVIGEVEQVSDKEADEYYNSRAYGSRISAWASSQSNTMESRDIFIQKIEEFKKKYPNEKNVPRPPHWSGWRIHPREIEFWVDGENRVHERLNYVKTNGSWIKKILYP